MQKCGFRIISALVLILTYIFTSVLPANLLPAFAAAPRFGIDETNTRQIKDSFTETGLPFHEAWTSICAAQLPGAFGQRQLGRDLPNH